MATPTRLGTAGAQPVPGTHLRARSAGAAAAPSPPEGRRRDDYRHLAPVVAAFAATAATDPRRAQLRDELMAAFWPLVVNIARRYRDRGEPVGDLQQIGAVGLLNALERFDPDRGIDFLGYAIPTITGEIRHHFRDYTWSIAVPRRLKDLQPAIRDATATLTASLRRAPRPSEIAAHLDIGGQEIVDALSARMAYRPDSLDALVGGEADKPRLGDLLGGADAAMSIAGYRDDLRRAVAALPERERAILLLRFFGELTQTQIAEQFGLSQMHISRLLNQTLATLRGLIGAPDDQGSTASDRARAG